MIKILILGGYGVFGGRLAELLADLPQATLQIAGRDLAKAQDFCARYSGKTRVVPLRLDRRDIAGALVTIAPDVVVDASGPFQAYGAKPYAVLEACIAAGVDYLDFADAADFVFGVTQFDHRARDAGVFVRPAYPAHARARFGLASLAPISRLFDAVLNQMKFGVHRGGMFVRARGDCNGEEVECSWHLLAEGDDGPFIPSMAIEGSAITLDPEASKADSPAPVQSHVAEPFTRISRGQNHSCIT